MEVVMTDNTKLTAASLLNDDADAMNKTVAGCLMEFEVTVRRWADAITDKKVADEVASARNITGNKVGQYKKHLLGDYRSEYEAMDSAYAAVRTRFYEVAMKLGHNKYAVFTSEAPDAYKVVHDAINHADQLAEKFFAAYPQRAAQAQAQLGNLVNSLEYPSEYDLRQRIGAKLSLNVMPDVRTLEGMTIPAELAAVYAADVGNKQREIVSEMVTGMYNGLVETTTDLANYFGKKAAGEKGSKMFDSKIAKIQRLSRQLQQAEGIVTTDFSGLSEAVARLAEADFVAAKASITAAEMVRDQAKKVSKALKSIAKEGASSPIIEPAAPANESTAEPDTLAETIEEALETEEPTYRETEEAKPIKPTDNPFADLDAMFF